LQSYQIANDQLQLLKNVAGKLNTPIAELERKIDALLAHQKELEKRVKSMLQRQAAETARGLVAQANHFSSVPAIVVNLGTGDGDYLQTVAEALKNQFKGVVVLGSHADGNVALLAAVASEFTAKIQAGKIIQSIAPLVGGKGGGRPDSARGGGKDALKLDEALNRARDLIKAAA
jgi:alanyl-tRNA synthetase